MGILHRSGLFHQLLQLLCSGYSLLSLADGLGGKGPGFAVDAAHLGQWFNGLVSPGSWPIQLWQFLLELLTDKSCQSFISWTGDGWEFKLSDPDEVRREWLEECYVQGWWERALGMGWGGAWWCFLGFESQLCLLLLGTSSEPELHHLENTEKTCVARWFS